MNVKIDQFHPVWRYISMESWLSRLSDGVAMEVTSPPLMADENSQVGKSGFEKFGVVRQLACKSLGMKAIN